MKQLELKHLCGYLPYGLKVCVVGESENEETTKPFILSGIHGDWVHVFGIRNTVDEPVMIEDCIPLLLPLSALTEPMEGQEKTTWLDYIWHEVIGIDEDMYGYDYFCELIYSDLCPIRAAEYLYAHHFDIHNLIESGLAIDKRTIK